jgi:hypothetical protein
MTGIQSRPGAVSGAVWCLVIGAVMLAAGGLITAAVSFDTLRLVAPESVPDESIRSSLWLYRGVGTLFALAAAALASLTVRAGRRDARFRRATMALALALTVIVAIVAALIGIHILALLSLVPIVVGTLLLSRPAVVAWFAGAADLEAGPHE